MDVGDLRIGNHYQLNDGVLGGGIATIKNDKDFVHAYEMLIGNLIKPIPLTEEWLLRFGFEGKIFRCNNIVFEYYDNSIFVKGMMGAVHPNKIKYVHQLQNLYWCLCGEEIQLKSE